MRYLAFGLLLSFAPQCFAQTAPKPIKSKALLKAETQLADAQAALQKANDQIAALTAERDKLASQVVPLPTIARGEQVIPVSPSLRFRA
jgi:hypothetical protein